jgi:hypothetical protein
MYQQLWGYKVEEKLYLGVREQKRLNTTELVYRTLSPVYAVAFVVATVALNNLPTLELVYRNLWCAV